MVIHNYENPIGWFLAIIQTRYVPLEPLDLSEDDETFGSEHIILIKASDSDAAYVEAMEHVAVMSSDDVVDVVTGEKGAIVCDGIRELIPVYDQLEDGAELLDTVVRFSSTDAANRIPPKEQLAAFRKHGKRDDVGRE